MNNLNGPLSWKDALKIVKQDKENYKIVKHEFHFFVHACMFKNQLNVLTKEFLEHKLIGKYNTKYNGFPVSFTRIRIFPPFHIDYSGGGYHVKGTARMLLFRPGYNKPFLTTIIDKSNFPTVEAETAGIRVRIDFKQYKATVIGNKKNMNVMLRSIKENAGTLILEAWYKRNDYNTSKKNKKTFDSDIEEIEQEPSVINSDSSANKVGKKRKNNEEESQSDSQKSSSKGLPKRKSNITQNVVEDTNVNHDEEPQSDSQKISSKVLPKRKSNVIQDTEPNVNPTKKTRVSTRRSAKVEIKEELPSN